MAFDGVSSLENVKLKHVAWALHYIARTYKQGNQENPLSGLMYSLLKTYSTTYTQDTDILLNSLEVMLNSSTTGDLSSIGELIDELNESIATSSFVSADDDAADDSALDDVRSSLDAYEVNKGISMYIKSITKINSTDIKIVAILINEIMSPTGTFRFFMDELESSELPVYKILLYSSFVMSTAYYRARVSSYSLYKYKYKLVDGDDTERESTLETIYNDLRDNFKLAPDSSVVDDMDGYENLEYFLKRVVPYIKKTYEMDLYASGCDEVDDESDDCLDILYAANYDIVNQFLSDGKNFELMTKVTIAWFKTFFDKNIGIEDPYQDLKLITFGKMENEDDFDKVGLISRSLSPTANIRGSRQNEIYKALLSMFSPYVTSGQFPPGSLSPFLSPTEAFNIHSGRNNLVTHYADDDVFNYYGTEKGLWIYPRSGRVFVSIGLHGDDDSNPKYTNPWSFYINISQTDPSYGMHLNLYSITSITNDLDVHREWIIKYNENGKLVDSDNDYWNTINTHIDMATDYSGRAYAFYKDSGLPDSDNFVVLQSAYARYRPLAIKWKATQNMYEFTTTNGVTANYYNDLNRLTEALYDNVSVSIPQAAETINLATTSSTDAGFDLFGKYPFIRADHELVLDNGGLQYDFEEIVTIDYVQPDFYKEITSDTANLPNKYYFIDSYIYNDDTSLYYPNHLKVAIKYEKIIKYLEAALAVATITSPDGTVSRLNKDDITIWIDLFRGLIYFIDSSFATIDQATGSSGYVYSNDSIDLFANNIYISLIDYPYAKLYGLFAHEIMPNDVPNNETMYMTDFQHEDSGNIMFGSDMEKQAQYNESQLGYRTAQSGAFRIGDIGSAKVLLYSNNVTMIPYNYNYGCESYRGKILDAQSAFFDYNTVDKVIIYTGREYNNSAYADDARDIRTPMPFSEEFLGQPRTPSYPTNRYDPAVGSNKFPIKYGFRLYSAINGYNYALARDTSNIPNDLLDHYYGESGSYAITPENELDLHFRNPYETDLIPLFDTFSGNYPSIWDMNDGITEEVYEAEITALSSPFIAGIMDYDPIVKAWELTKTALSNFGFSGAIGGGLTIFAIAFVGSFAAIGTIAAVTGTASAAKTLTAVGAAGKVFKGVAIKSGLIALAITAVVIGTIWLVSRHRAKKAFSNNVATLDDLRRRISHTQYDIFYNGYIRNLAPFWKGFRFFDYVAITASAYELEEMGYGILSETEEISYIPSAVTEGPYLGEVIYGGTESEYEDNMQEWNGGAVDWAIDKNLGGGISSTGDRLWMPGAYDLERKVDSHFVLYDHISVRTHYYTRLWAGHYSFNFGYVAPVAGGSTILPVICAYDGYISAPDYYGSVQRISITKSSHINEYTQNMNPFYNSSFDLVIPIRRHHEQHGGNKGLHELFQLSMPVDLYSQFHMLNYVGDSESVVYDTIKNSTRGFFRRKICDINIMDIEV